MKKLMVKLANAAHHRQHQQHEEMAPDAMSTSSSSNSEDVTLPSIQNPEDYMYDEESPEWTTHVNPLFDCYFCDMGLVEERYMTMAHGKKRRNSSLVRSCSSPRQASKLTAAIFNKLEFESNWQVTENFLTKFEKVELMSRKETTCLYHVKKEGEYNGRVLRLIQANNYNHAQNILEQVNKIKNSCSFEHLIRIYETTLIGEDIIAIEMEHVELGDLESLVEEENIYLSDVMIAKIIYQVCKSLELLHENHDVHHGEIRPHNILVKSFNADEDDIEIVLSDFGWKEAQKDKRFDCPRDSLGDANDNTNFAADVYQLGVSIFQICSRDHDLILSRYLEQNMDECSLRKTLCSKLTTYFAYLCDLQDVILQMLAKNPRERPSASQVLSTHCIVNLA